MAKCTWQHVLNACLAAACLRASGNVLAGDTDPFAVPRNAPGTTRRDAPAGDGTAAPVAAIDRSSERQLLEASQRTAAEVTEFGGSAFRRGLMPLRDYLQQVSLVTQIDVMDADVRADSPAGALQQQVARLQEVRDRLRQFRQPNAQGWAADVALAEWALANAEFDLALAQGDVVAEQTAEVQRQQWAAEQLRRRTLDADIGRASLPDVAHAASVFAMSSSGSERTARAAEYRLLLERIAARTAEWAADDAGIGRADRVLQSRFEVNFQRIRRPRQTAHSQSTPGRSGPRILTCRSCSRHSSSSIVTARQSSTISLGLGWRGETCIPPHRRQQGL